MVVEKLNKLASNVEKHNNKVLFEFETGIYVSCLKFEGVYTSIVLNKDELVFFDGISPFARILNKKYWNTLEFE